MRESRTEGTRISIHVFSPTSFIPSRVTPTDPSDIAMVTDKVHTDDRINSTKTHTRRHKHTHLRRAVMLVVFYPGTI